MSFLAQETSQESGRPVELYQFILSSVVYRYTSAEDDQVIGADTYLAVAIKRGRLTHGQEARNATLTVEMPGDLDFPSRYVRSVPSERARVLIRRMHRGDGELIVVFDGVVKSVAFGAEGSGRVASVAVEPAITATSRSIPRYTYRGLCNHTLYDSLCTINPELPAYKFTGIVSAQAGKTLTVPGAGTFGTGWFEAGTVELLTGLDGRLVIRQVGDVLTLHIQFPNSMIGEQVVLRAGCAHDIQTCSTKFANVPNFGGFAFVPTRNIFTQGLDTAAC
jgi:uncharacterized phage protein (TIGR02218 family)